MPKEEKPESTVFVPLSEIREPTFDVRIRKDPSALRSLADDINENGLQTPITLQDGGPPYEIVYGHRRFLACKLLNRPTIQAFIRHYDPEALIMIRAGENIHREDLSIIEEGRVYKHMVDTYGMSQNAVAKKLSRSGPHVLACIAALDLPDFVQEALQVKAIPFAAIKHLMKIEEEQWRIFYMRAAVDHGASVEVARRWLEEWRRGAEKRELEQHQEPERIPIEERVIKSDCQLCQDPVKLEEIRAIHTCSHCYNWLIHDIPHPRAKDTEQQHQA